MNVKELALAYMACRRSLIWEYSGDISGDVEALADEMRKHVNPLLERHGYAPLEIDDECNLIDRNEDRRPIQGETI